MDKITDAESSENARVKALETEKQGLLEELESAYKHLEEILGVKNHETDIAYQELRKKNLRLEQRLKELQETQHMLVRSERMSAMGQMAAAIVHEINNPLTVLSGRIQLLLMQEELECRDDLLQVYEAAEDMVDMTRNILRFSRQKRGETQAVISHLDLNELARGVLQFFVPLLKMIAVDTQLASDLPPVAGNASQIEQVLTNFIVNAADAMDGHPDAALRIETGLSTPAELLEAEQAAGRIVRRVGRGSSEQEHPCAFVAVHDSGPGIDEQTLDQIFEAFFTTKDEDKGTGLGLAICRSIAESLGGDILVASRPGNGSSFRLLLPLTKAGKHKP